MATHPGNLGSFLLLGFLSLGWIFYAIFRSSRNERLPWILCLFFLGKCILCVANYTYQLIPLQMDAALYHECATSLSYVLRTHGIGTLLEPGFYEGVVEPGYTIILALLYRVFGETELVGYLLNTFLFSITSLNIYRIGKLIFGPKAGSVTAIFYNFMPYSALDAIYLHRDPMVIMVLSAFFLSLLICTRARPPFTAKIAVLFTTILSGLLRRENFIILSLALTVVYFHRTLQRRNFLTMVRLELIVVAVIAYAIYISYGTEVWLFQSFHTLTTPDGIQRRLEMFNPESSYLSNQTIDSFADALRFAPIRVVYFLFSPFPWSIFKTSQSIAFIEAILATFPLLALPGAMLYLYRRERTFFYAVLIYLICGVTGASLIQSNSAAAQRHRTQFTFLIVTVGISYYVKRRGQKQRPKKSLASIHEASPPSDLDRQLRSSFYPHSTRQFKLR